MHLCFITLCSSICVSLPLSVRVQVRAKALLTLNIAHTVGSQRSTAFPVEDLARMLMFPDIDEASNFVQQYGLVVNDG